MEGGVRSSSDKQGLVSSFLEIAVGQTPDIARQFLEATSWQLEEAIQLFYVGNDGGAAAITSSPPLENDPPPLPDQSLSASEKHPGEVSTRQNDGDNVRAPLPVKREVLYDAPVHYRSSRLGYQPHETPPVVPFRNFDEELKRSGIWESNRGASSTADSSRDNLASLYRPPFALIHHGPFEKAKDAAKAQNKWLLVNLQSTREFSSHMLNRDTWANEAVAQTISSNFIFWQIYDDTEEGSKISTYYKLDSAPLVLVIDPITGQKMWFWRGMIHPETLLEDLLPFMDGSPKDHHFSFCHKRPRESSLAPPAKVNDGNDEDEELQMALAASVESMRDSNGISSSKDKAAVNTKVDVPKYERPTYPPLPEESQVDRGKLCRVLVRLPNGRRVQRNFLCTDPIQLLWSFCSAHLDEDETRPFRLTQPVPRASKVLNYDDKLTFEEAGVANSMISATWE